MMGVPEGLASRYPPYERDAGIGEIVERQDERRRQVTLSSKLQ
jgi:hypothetical protein